MGRITAACWVNDHENLHLVELSHRKCRFLKLAVAQISLGDNATGQGGNCFYDSGSPVFRNTGGRDVLVAVRSGQAGPSTRGIGASPLTQG